MATLESSCIGGVLRGSHLLSAHAVVTEILQFRKLVFEVGELCRVLLFIGSKVLATIGSLID